MKIQAGISGKQYYLDIRMMFGNAVQLLSEVVETDFAPQEDDPRLLQGDLREQVTHPDALSHHNYIVTVGEGFSHTGQQQRIVVGDGNIDAVFLRIRVDDF